MSQIETATREIVKMGLLTIMVASLAAPLTMVLPSTAAAHSFVKTKQECTRNGGAVKALTVKKGGITDRGYRFECDTPRLDSACELKHGFDWYFDAEYGKCMHDDGLEPNVGPEY